MKTRWVISLIVLGAFILFPQDALADDLADLKATHQGFTQAWNTGDFETGLSFWHEAGIFMPASRAFPIMYNAARAKMLWSQWMQTHSLIFIWYKPDYRVMGDMGLVWGLQEEVILNRDKGIGERRFRKVSITFVKSEGKWKIYLYHSSPLPKKDKIF